jgi:hypothetical protein
MSTTPSSMTNTSRANSINAKSPLMKLPVELRLIVYRYYFDMLTKSKMPPCTVLPSLGVDVLSLLHSSSQIRREASPIFYKEYIGNTGPTRSYHWKLVAIDFEDMVSRLKALSASLAQNAPNATVEVRVFPPSTYMTVVDVESKLRLGEASRLYAEQVFPFTKALRSCIDRQINRSSHGRKLRDGIQDGELTEVARPFDDTGIVNHFIVHQGYANRLSVIGPLAKVDWSGLTL